MYDCNYSIIPVVGKESTCTYCGDKLDDLPYYSQIMEMFIGIGQIGQQPHFLGLGIGTPMCWLCEEKISGRIRLYKRILKCYGFIAPIFIMAGLEVMLEDGFSVRILLMMIAVVVLFFCINGLPDIFMKKKYGDKIMTPVFASLSQDGWSRKIDDVATSVDYDEARFMADIDRICKHGDFCVLDNTTGYIVDYRDPDVLHKIFCESLYVTK